MMVNTTYKRGGAAFVARTLHRELNDVDGYESLFAYGRGRQSEAPRTVRFALQVEVSLHRLLTAVTGLQGYGTWASSRRLLRLIQDWKPDLIHLHNIHGYYLDVGIARALSQLGIPIVWTLHDAWLLTGRCAFFLECSRWRTGCGHCPNLRSYPKTYFDSSALMWRRKRALLGYGFNPVIVTPSQWLGDLVSQACAGRCFVEVIPNGVNTKLFCPRNRIQTRIRLELPQEKRIVLLVAADLKSERKGIEFFFKSLEFIKVDDWMVLTVGKKIQLPQAIISRYDIKQLGYVGVSDQMAEVYSAADVFCITSLDDNFPTTVLESMSCGTPVVGFSTGGISEQVSEECGRLVDAKNAQALGKAITVILEDDELRRKMGKQCRKKAENQYDLRLFSERYLALYKKAVRGGRSE